MSFAAYEKRETAKQEKDQEKKNKKEQTKDAIADISDGKDYESEAGQYSIENIIDDGCFLEPERLEKILQSLREKKNIILQGPPGTGKTWLAKRLAYALMGQAAPERVCNMQFHQSLSYEDFVEGFRPGEDGRLSLAKGPFLELSQTAQSDAGDYVFVIDEINRGNPAQIFGELLTLLEADKRRSFHAMQLIYSREAVCLPKNLYLIGTMNLADRSLAVLDFAFRRRFAFVDLDPQINERWLEWVHESYGYDKAILQAIQERMQALNKALAADSNLGPHYQIGHSFVTPSRPMADAEECRSWFRQKVETEIAPLLEEYYFDSPEKAKDAAKTLAADF